MKSDINIELSAPLLSGTGTLPGILVKPTALPWFLSQRIEVQAKQASFIPPVLWRAHQVFGDAS